jgi:hypothetical protein
VGGVIYQTLSIKLDFNNNFYAALFQVHIRCEHTVPTEQYIVHTTPHTDFITYLPQYGSS